MMTNIIDDVAVGVVAGLVVSIVGFILESLLKGNKKKKRK